MTNTTLPPPSEALNDSLVRFTTDQYHLMIDQGIIPEDSSTELLNGLMITKDRADLGAEEMGHGPAHRLAVRLLTKLVSRIDSDARHFQIQLPIHISTFNEPEPDGAIIAGADQNYADHLPTASDVLCVIEVAYSSLERDKYDKLPIYAGAGIAQYIIVNLRENQIEAYSNPDAPTGVYRSKSLYAKGQTLRISLGESDFIDVQANELL